MEAGLLVEPSGVDLGLQDEAVRVEEIPGGLDAGGEDPAPQSLPAADGDDPTDGGLVKGGPRREQAQVGEDLLPLLEPDVVGGEVRGVHLLVGALLLHHEDGDTELVDLLQLRRGELGEMLSDLFHRVPLSFGFAVNMISQDGEDGKCFVLWGEGGAPPCLVAY